MTAPLFSSAIGALDFILGGCLRLPIAKALDPNDPQDFVAIVNALAKQTKGLAGPEEAAALKKALDELDVNWPKLSSAQVDKVIGAAKQNISGTYAKTWPKVEELLKVDAQKIGLQTKKSAKEQFDLGVSVDFDKVDARTLDHLAKSQGLFVRDEYGKRSDIFSAKAKQVVDAGLKAGMGRKEIGAELDKQLTAQQFNRSRAYWDVIAGSFANRARTYSNLSAFEQAEIETFTFVAMLDERTSVVCRFMHGKSFTVEHALQAYGMTEELDNPEEIKSSQPWLQVGKDKDGSQFIYYKDGNGDSRHVTDIAHNATGQVDEVGSFKNSLSDATLQKRGIMTPPLHGHCRSTIEADVESVSVQVPGQLVPEGAPVPQAPAPPAPPAPPPPPPAAPAPALPPPPVFQAAPLGGGAPVALTPLPQDAKALALEKLEAMKAAVPPGLMVQSPIAPLDEASKKLFFSKLASIEQAMNEATFKPQLKGPQYLKVLDGAVDPLQLEYLLKDKKLLDKQVIKVVQMPNKNFVVVDGHDAAAAQQLLGKQKFKIHVVSMKEWEAEQQAKAHAAALSPKAPPLPPPVAAPPAPVKPDAFAVSAQEAQAALLNDYFAGKIPLSEVQTPKPLTAGKPVDPANIMHEKTAGPAGSNEGGFYTGADGVKRYVKFYNDPAQAHGEALANSVYQSLGVGAPKAVVFEHGGKHIYASEIVEGKTFDQVDSKAAAKKFFDGFASDVLLGNWDAAGATGDNALVNREGSVLRIDNGGALLMRAKAGRKPISALNSIPEVEVFFSGKNPGYSKIAKAAGYSSVDDFKDDFIRQVGDISKMRAKWGGWGNFVDQYAAQLNGDDRHLMRTMLEERTKRLEELAKDLSKPKKDYVAGGGYFSPPIKGAPPRAGLKITDLPHAPPPPGTGSRSHPSKLPSGEKHEEYYKRTKKMVDAVPDAQRVNIKNFTDGSFSAVRDSEAAGKPNAASKSITEAFKNARPEPGTVWRGINGLAKAHVEAMIQNDGVFRLGMGNTGATTSTSWHSGVAVQRFMGGENEPIGDYYKMLIKINGKSQIPIESISSFGDVEAELLVSRETEYRVVSAARWEGREKIIILELEEI